MFFFELTTWLLLVLLIVVIVGATVIGLLAGRACGTGPKTCANRSP